MNLTNLTDEQLRAEFRNTLANYNLYITLKTTFAEKERFRQHKDIYLGEILTELKKRLMTL